MVFEQLTIPGVVVNIYPTSREECLDLLHDVYRCMAKSTVPEEYMKVALPSVKHRTALKRLREKMISDGYRLKMHLEEGSVKASKMQELLWKEKVILFWNHFSLSIERMNDYIKTNALKYEEA